ncbi:universal stress protein [Arenibacter sp. TNZ]|jgi:nucleotide-binding universal stress UspA family protein|uniref:universal stress protein n=1 Tax=Arenibacter TaxID=178469 RepID=UPI000CD47EC7|nr:MULTISPECIES: universal stress protein [Arenibacter]MCM4171900.1 universal stress protein [Arenibacter sp. TNZ]
MRILIPTDFSELSKVAIKYSVDLSKDVDIQLILLHVIDTNAPSRARIGSHKLQEAIKTSSENSMKELIGSIKKDNSHNIDISYEITSGSSIEKYVEIFALKNNIDMICIGTKGASGLKKILFGSNAAGIIQNSSIPVLTIPEFARYKGIGNIVYSSDLYNLDKEIDLIIPFAKLMDSWIHILHIDKDNERFEGDLQQKEESLRKDFSYQKIKAIELKSNSVIDGINKFVADVDADMVIMFTHHTNFLEKVFQKSVTQNTAFQTRIPLFTFQKES